MTPMWGAVCVRCGAPRLDYAQICPSCGHRPEGEGLLVAWLLSEHNLDEEGLREAAERIREGHEVQPSRRMLDKARRALGSDFHSDPGLTVVQQLGLALIGIALTPLPGLVLWAWWRRQRPRAAVQALALSLPLGLVSAGIVLWALYG